MAIIDAITISGVNQWVLRVFISIGVILLGIFLGNIINVVLTKFTKKIELSKYVRTSFISLFLMIIRWSVYIIFFNFALNQLEIPALTNFITGILIIIPAFTASIILISIGFALAVYLRELVEDIEMTGWKILSQILFYFVIYVFGVYALKTAFISINEMITNYVILILTGIIGGSLAYISAKKQLQIKQK